MSENPSGSAQRKVGLFDIRVIIAALIGVYGVILVITGLLSSDAQAEKAAGLNINLIAGVVMIAFSLAFVAWARLRPIVVPADPEETGEGRTGGEDDRPAQ